MPLAERITSAVQHAHPFNLCFGCLAFDEGVTEAEIRDAAQVALIRDGLRLVQRACYRCGHLAEVLVPRETGRA
jgi:hypothetical protein